jgi:hypothetical protein
MAQHFVQHDTIVKYVDLNMPDDRWRLLQTELNDMGEVETAYADGDVERYCKRPDEHIFQNMLIRDFYANYDYRYVRPGVRTQFHSLGNNRYLVRRTEPCVTRIRKLYPRNGETYYYQLLLMSVPFRDVNTLKAEGETFEQACRRRC